jgi:hypothetical protein
MAKEALFLFFALIAVNSVHLLPRKDFVQPNSPENSKKRYLIRKKNTEKNSILNSSRTLAASWSERLSRRIEWTI